MEILEKLGSIAGIGGISLGVLMLLFRNIIRKKIFPTLTKEQGFKIIQRIILLTWSIAVLGLVSWLLVELYNPEIENESQKYEELIPIDTTKVD